MYGNYTGSDISELSVIDFYVVIDHKHETHESLITNSVFISYLKHFFQNNIGKFSLRVNPCKNVRLLLFAYIFLYFLFMRRACVVNFTYSTNENKGTKISFILKQQR